ncbi:carboxypeptidase N subunit 2-like isoform X2 [Sipha flava]|nr:carboxypeptidase N subunit 2-like isoform X2 [Sipha flava]
MNSMVVILLLMGIVSLTAAQTTIKCFESNNKGRDKKNILLDCSNTTGKNHTYSVEEWIRHHAFVDEGILANRVSQVNLENNDIEMLFTLPKMSSLKKLSFKHNKISSVENQALSNLQNLEELDLSHNSLKGYELRLSLFFDHQRQNVLITNDESIHSSKSVLKVLKLGNNNIHSLTPNFFEYLSNLEELEISNNPLSVIDQNTELALGYLTNLQFLDLSYTGLSEFPEGMFSHMSNVETLYLKGNEFQKIPNEIRSMPLAFLNMNENPIVCLDNKSFTGLDKLQELIISSLHNLTDIGSGTFSPLKKLNILHMAQNPSLLNIHPNAFGDYTTNKWSLRQLIISNTNLSSLDSNLYPWEKLDWFDAKDNPWMCDCRLSWLASYINETFAEMPEELLHYRCHAPRDISGILISQLNNHIDCNEPDKMHPNNNIHSHVTRLRHFIIVIGLVISILVFGSLINMCCREINKILKPRLHVPSRFSSGVKYKPADFEENLEPLEVPVKNIMIHGRSPIVINNTNLN